MVRLARRCKYLATITAIVRMKYWEIISNIRTNLKLRNFSFCYIKKSKLLLVGSELVGI